MLDILQQQWLELSRLELIAVLCAITYLVLNVREHIACWAFAIISSAIYVYLLFNFQLYMESVSNVLYVIMGIYGWKVWADYGPDDQRRAVESWPVSLHLQVSALLAGLSLGLGFALARYTDAAYPYVDTLTTVFSFWATFLVTRKVLENWWYWLIIDITLIFLFWYRGLNLTSLLFVIYVMLIPFGYYSWRKSYRSSVTAG